MISCLLIGLLCSLNTPPDASKVVYASTTAYVCTLDEACIMASGKKGYKGAIACSRGIPKGTKMRIDGVMYTCEDRLHQRFDQRVDIFYGYGDEAKERALQYGIKVERVEII